MSMLGIAFAVATGIIIVAWLSTPAPFSRDDTDQPGGKRSGLTLYVDHGTGVEYVGTLMGGLTPRLDASGNIMIRKVQP